MRSSVRAHLGLVFCIATLAGAAVRTAQPLGDIQVRQAWIRWLPAGVPGGGYMTVFNSGPLTRVLTGAASPDYAAISFHRTHSKGGVNEMTPVDSIAIEPNIPVRFAAGGYHLMLMQPRRSLHPGDQVTITLRFADGKSVDVSFSVRAGNSP